MTILDYAAVLLICFAVVCAVISIIRTKKQGKGCSGCPYSESCKGKCGGNDKNGSKT